MRTFVKVTADRKGIDIIKTAARKAGSSKRHVGWIAGSLTIDVPCEFDTPSGKRFFIVLTNDANHYPTL